MGRVVHGIDPGLDRSVAIKSLHPSLIEKPDVVERFIREARLTAALDHPNVLPVHAVGLDDAGVPLMTMKLIDGGSLQDRLNEHRRPPRGEDLFELVDILIRVCDALARTHDLGFVHGDVKARNVMLGAHHAVYLVDWGNAQRIGSRPSLNARGKPIILGTPSCMAPEQARGDTVDARTDVFGVGALLYTVLAKRVPYSRGGAGGPGRSRKTWNIPPHRPPRPQGARRTSGHREPRHGRGSRRPPPEHPGQTRCPRGLASRTDRSPTGRREAWPGAHDSRRVEPRHVHHRSRRL